MMRPDDRRLDKAIGTRSPNEDGMKLAGVTCENNSDNKKVVEENVHTVKRLYIKKYCDCKNSGDGERKFAGNNKRFYEKRSNDCNRTGDEVRAKMKPNIDVVGNFDKEKPADRVLGVGNENSCSRSLYEMRAKPDTSVDIGR